MENENKVTEITEEITEVVTEDVQPEAGLPTQQTDENQPVEDLAVPEVETPEPVENEVVETAPEGVEEVAASSENTEEEEEEQHEDEYQNLDLHGMTKGQLLDLLRQMAREEDIRKVDKVFKEIRTHYDEFFETEKKHALEQFLAGEGNEEADFDYKGDETDRNFNELYDTLRHKRAQFFHLQEKLKEENLHKKTVLLDEIRRVVDSEEPGSFNKIKQLQADWRKIGAVPAIQSKTLWANYHALMDRFYDQRSIYFELKELDRKKNLEAKLSLCEKVEHLEASGDLRMAVIMLNELHEEFRHIGPVPADQQETVWTRFKSASDRIYEQRRSLTEETKKQLMANLAKKKRFVEQAAGFATYTSDRIKEWNSKTKELLELQKQWEAVGGVPREQSKEINKAFWSHFKHFFANKNQFFKGMEGERETNMAKKRDLIERAKSLRESEEWDTATAELIKLQKEWRDIGPVPEKYRKSVYDEFKEHCDYFFNRRRGVNAQQNREFDDNLKRKLEILKGLEEVSKSDAPDVDGIFDKLDEYASVGLVPRNAVGKTLGRYDEVAEKLLAMPILDQETVAELRTHLQVCKMRNSPNGERKLGRKEHSLKRRITGLENDINNWQNNLEFFGRSKNAEQMKNDFQVKIDKAKKELDELKQQLRVMNY
jgi:hypothetical protein